MQCRAPFLHCLSNTLPATKDPIRKTNCEIKNKTVTQVLIHWDGLSPADATWEFTDELKLQFPQFNLEDRFIYVQLKKMKKKKLFLQIQTDIALAASNAPFQLAKQGPFLSVDLRTVLLNLHHLLKVLGNNTRKGFQWLGTKSHYSFSISYQLTCPLPLLDTIQIASNQVLHQPSILWDFSLFWFFDWKIWNLGSRLFAEK